RGERLLLVRPVAGVRPVVAGGAERLVPGAVGVAERPGPGHLHRTVVVRSGWGHRELAGPTVQLGGRAGGAERPAALLVRREPDPVGALAVVEAVDGHLAVAVLERGRQLHVQERVA